MVSQKRTGAVNRDAECRPSALNALFPSWPAYGLAWCAILLVFGPGLSSTAQTPLPNAPWPQPDAIALLTGSADAAAPALGSGVAPAPVADPGAPQETFPPTPRPSRSGLNLPGLEPNYVPTPRRCIEHICSERSPQRLCCERTPNYFGDYLSENAAQIYTPRQLGMMAIRGVIDPFNLLTIVATSAFSVATDANSPYGPGLKGWGKLSGVTLNEDLTSEFVGTFFIPSLDHQDPHFHRLPNAPMQLRILHCIYQPFWTQNMTGQGMVNYSNIAGAIIEEAVDVTYVPFQKVGWGASADRIATNYATMPIGNFVTEFVPDVARHINLHAVFLQRIINRVAVEEGSGPF